MPTIVEQCPRCSAKNMTFDVVADVFRGSVHGWMHRFEICIVCRRCVRPSLLRIGLKSYKDSDIFSATSTVAKAEGDLEPRFESIGFVDVGELNAKPCPELLPDDVERAFREGSKCLAISCPNAASAMFRLALDLATKAMLTADGEAGGPTNYQRKNLSARLEWLFVQNRLPSDLKDLSNAVRDHGNDGAHDGNVEQIEADDIYDFAFALFERLFTQPARIKIAEQRREERRKVTLS